MMMYVGCVLLALVLSCDALTFSLAPNESRCVTETLRAQALLTGDWAFTSDAGAGAGVLLGAGKGRAEGGA